MILSASRRTDLPAFYSTWWMNRVRAGFCEVPNPLRPSQVSRVSLEPQDVEAVVFWTRNPLPMLAHLDELETRGLRSIFLVTLIGYPRELDPHCLSVERAVQAFQRLSRRLGPERVVWRYDPLILSPATDADWHRRRFAELARSLRGFTRCCKLSLVDLYPRLARRLRVLEGTPHQIAAPSPDGALLRDLLRLALENDIRLESCAEELEAFGIPAGACLDAAQLGRVFGLRLPRTKDPGQRQACRCAPARDVGVYDSCPAGCVCCYAVRDFNLARLNRRRHDPLASTMLPLKGAGRP
jgi:hypothetical protein